MRGRETFLWVVFLALCFGAGYLKGILPEYRFHFFWSDEEKVQVLIYSEKLLPPFLVSDIEKQTNTEIEIHISQTYSDFLTQSVAKSKYYLFIIPRSWSDSLKDQGLLLPLSGLKDFFQKKMHADFPVISSRQFPWAWVLTLFIKPKSLTDSKKIDQLSMIQDDDHLYQVLKRIPNFDQQLEIKTHLLFDDVTEITNHQIKEINSMDLKDYGDVQVETSWPQSLYLFDVVIPQNSPKRITSIDILKAMFSTNHLISSFQDQSFGLTQDFYDQSLFPTNKKPSALRNQPLQKLLRPSIVESDEKQALLKKYRINSH